jgi:Na+/H+ antiporter NhaD/arsenite permease-like protein
MLLIRPWMTLNDSRYRAFHTVFFILVVSNCGGCLTPIGDPPLFMGFLRGVPFFWTATIAGLPWILVITFLILAFLGFEAFHRKPETPFHKATGIRVEGLANIGWLLLIIAAIFIPEPIFLREAIMLVAAFGSYFLTPKRLHDLNRFTFAPIKEVAWLFLGIFATMMPALDYLSGHAKGLGLESPTALYWWTGSLSAVLDNAPTYICFLTAAISVQGGSVESAQDVQRFATDHASALGAISLAAVFFGAITYIGNGPNLMVRSVVLHAHKAAPSFFAYTLRYALPLLLPALVLVWWLFVR